MPARQEERKIWVVGVVSEERNHQLTSITGFGDTKVARASSYEYDNLSKLNRARKEGRHDISETVEAFGRYSVSRSLRRARDKSRDIGLDIVFQMLPTLLPYSPALNNSSVHMTNDGSPGYDQGREKYRGRFGYERGEADGHPSL
jgi:hypothetical protein